MKRPWAWSCGLLAIALALGACYPTYTNPVRLTVPTQVPQPREVNLVGLRLPGPQSCLVHSVDLIGAWVAAGRPESDLFAFKDVGGRPCHASFDADVLPLFAQANLWYPGALSCRTCHGPDVAVSNARLDLSTFAGIIAGSGRVSADKKGDDILGAGQWDSSKLFEKLSHGEMPPNGPKGLDPRGPVIPAGMAN
jgi:hypothetical protein